ncbi:MAG: DUF1993 family protein [Gammaproteobacteria bacterium]
MSTSLYDMSIGSYLQVVPAVAAFMDKAAEHCKANDVALDDVVATSLHPDMWSFHAQVVGVVHQSMGVVKGMRSGEFSPPSGYPETDYAGLQKLIADTLAQLQALTEDEINGLAGGKVVFKLGEMELPFTTENFVLSFSLPNFYFHATTGYDILRMLGVPVGKRDFLGKLKVGV